MQGDFCEGDKSKLNQVEDVGAHYMRYLLTSGGDESD